MSNFYLCDKCVNKKFNLQEGILCGLTNEKPNFIDHCPDFVQIESKNEPLPRLKPNKERAKFILAFIWIILILEIISIISSSMQYSLLLLLENNVYVSDETIDNNDLREEIINVFIILAYIASSITFILWFRRAYYNLHQRVKTLRFGEGWAAGSWFVPFINLYRPYQIMKELYEETKIYLERNNPTMKIKTTTLFVGWWWALYLLSGFVNRIDYNISNKASSISDFFQATTFNIIGSTFSVILCLITIKVIRDYSKVEDLLIKNQEQFP